MIRYYMLLDEKQEFTNPKHALFFLQRTNTDIIGNIIYFAQRNNTKLEDIRLFCFENKQQYENTYKEWISQLK